MYTQRVQEMEGKSRVEDFYRKDEPEMLFLSFFFVCSFFQFSCL